MPAAGITLTLLLSSQGPSRDAEIELEGYGHVYIVRTHAYCKHAHVIFRIRSPKSKYIQNTNHSEPGDCWVLKKGAIKPNPDFDPPEPSAEGAKMNYNTLRMFLDGVGGGKLSEHDRLTLIECLDPAGTGMNTRSGSGLNLDKRNGSGWSNATSPCFI